MRKTGETLISWGITPNLLGYRYIIDALEIIKENPEAKHKLHNGIYPKIAQKYYVETASIERGIRTAIGKIKSLQHQEVLPKPMQMLIDRNLLCTSTFLSTFAEIEGGAANEAE